MRKHILFLVITLIYLGTSCEKKLDTEFDFKPQMVVTGILIPGRDIEIRLMANFPTNQNTAITPIESATVSLFEGDAPMGHLTHTTGGIYTMQAQITEGKTYTLRASCNGFPPIEATTTIPTTQSIPVEKQPSLSTKTENTQLTDNPCIRIELPATTSVSYYGLLCYNVWEMPLADGIHKLYGVCQMEVSDKLVEFMDYSFYYRSSWDKLNDFTDMDAEQELQTYFTDIMVGATDGYIFFLSSESYVGERYVLNLEDYGTPYLNIYQMSAELYKSFKGIAAQRSTQNGLFVTPVPAYNCIEGGLGYFGGVLVQTVELIEPDGNFKNINNNQ